MHYDIDKKISKGKKFLIRKIIYCVQMATNIIEKLTLWIP